MGPVKPMTLALRNAFGADLRAKGEYVRARELDEETLELHEQEFGPDNPQTLRVKNNLALDYGFNGDYKRRESCMRPSTSCNATPVEGVAASEVLSSQIGLARAVRLCGNFAAARDLGADAYAFGREELGAEHFLTLRAATDLSIALRRIPDGREEALELAEEVLQASTRLFAEKNPGTMAAAVSLSNIQRTMARLDDALGLARQSRDNYQQVFGSDHPYTMACTGNLALLYRLMGDLAQARALDESAHDGLAQRLSEDHFYTLTVAVNLASDLAALAATAAARDLGVQDPGPAASRGGSPPGPGLRRQPRPRPASSWRQRRGGRAAGQNHGRIQSHAGCGPPGGTGRGGWRAHQLRLRPAAHLSRRSRCSGTQASVGPLPAL